MVENDVIKYYSLFQNIYFLNCSTTFRQRHLVSNYAKLVLDKLSAEADRVQTFCLGETKLQQIGQLFHILKNYKWLYLLT